MNRHEIDKAINEIFVRNGIKVGHGLDSFWDAVGELKSKNIDDYNAIIKLEKQWLDAVIYEN